MTTKEETTKIVATIPKALHMQFKIQAVKEGIQMQELLQGLMVQYLSRKTKGEKKAA